MSMQLIFSNNVDTFFFLEYASPLFLNCKYDSHNLYFDTIKIKAKKLVGSARLNDIMQT